MAVGRAEVEIRTARSDKRAYRRLVLPNSLEVLLISDPETDKAAASMNVAVGSFSDPEGLEGLAHFLEHMLFFASEKYPVEDSYSKYISEHGGSTNAYTSGEDTNFYFDVNADNFEEALDRFAQFFIKPLMSSDASLREIKAVDSENQKNLLSDGWRMGQLEKHLSSKNHSYHKFSTGNWNTLETIPKSRGLDTHKELIKFYKEHYSASLMYLCVYGKGSLDEIQNLVEKRFCDIPNTGISHFNLLGQPCTSEYLQILVKAVPIKEGHTLRITWPITPSMQYYKEGPTAYLGHLIGHEGNGSLYCALKALGWAVSLGAGEGESYSDFAFFSVVIVLTDAGHEHVHDIIGLLFKYIAMLQKSGINKLIFDELVAICETGFHYQDKVPPIDYVTGIALNMKLYPPEDWLVASSLPSKFNPITIQMILDELNENNARIFWESKKFEGCTDLVEPWYGTSYLVEKTTSSLIQDWMAGSPDVLLHLPAENIFIATDLAIKHVEDKVRVPILLKESSYSRLWFKPDTMFFTPKAYLKLNFHCPHSRHSPEAGVLTDIFTYLLVDYLNEYAYNAQIAGLCYGISHNDTGFQVALSGYNHKMRILLDSIVTKIANFEVKADRFAVIKETMIKGYENVKFQQPYEQALYYSSLLMEDDMWSWSEQHGVLLHLEPEDLAKFSPILLSRAFLECYVAGNLEPCEAESIVQHIENVMFSGPNPICRPLKPSEHLAFRIVKLKKGSTYYYPVQVLNPSEENSALIHYIQVHQDNAMLNVKLQLFILTAKQPAFHQLRTVEQLGYITHLCGRYDSGIRGLEFIIQSNVKDPAQLDSRTEDFLVNFEAKLNEMTEEEHKNNVNALIEMKLEKFKNLGEESYFYWSEIAEGTLQFDRIENEVAALRKLTKQDLVEFFNEYIKVGSPRRRTLVIQVYGNLHSAGYEKAKSEPNQNNCTQIEDAISFRKSRPLYGSFRGGSIQTRP